MGEIADMMINGELDFYTGEYIGRGFGIPRTSNRSLPWEKPDYTQSKEVAFKGLRKYLKYTLQVDDITPIINEYMPGNDKSMKRKCFDIQKDFGAFVKWINQTKK